MMGKINEAVRCKEVWLDEERTIMDGRYIIQDRLIFAATNPAPLLSLRGKWVFEISAAHKYVKDWQRTFEKEKKSTRIEQARQSSKAKKQKDLRRLGGCCARGALRSDQGVARTGRRRGRDPARGWGDRFLAARRWRWLVEGATRARWHRGRRTDEAAAQGATATTL
mmetsp:Transcript_20774/g.61750  ORF Transcript_20774/g.61750 Transcript_20774/m.61750 type:complete len:167 (-) Transcript_20774:330-830(-)